MKFPFPLRRFRKPTPRTWLGLALVGVSIGGTVAVVADNAEGTGMVLATRFIPAGSTVESEDVVAVRVSAPVEVSELLVDDIVGRRLAVDVYVGDIVTEHALDSTIAPRRIIAVPLGVTSARSLSAGSRVELWFVATLGSEPPRMVAHDAILISSLEGSFGAGDLLEVSIDSRDEDAVLAAIGADGLILATEGTEVS